ncbi:hypothetical protein NJH78_18725 [Pseudomonas chlororaphis]|uniref:hypothetical protein n=1 Tax=Pseudomonas chlororaphis TaxID=587753 RepID=UPI00209BA0A1|nr:hypothetical protein [Pseudomonas chlororaphis]MCO7572023.1 hypothetical protein [Pseudomonas chlororaphis]MCO7589803.1 hypothetical protein [Pseudomonas chlororaphis]
MSSIRLGVEDFKAISGDEARALSAIRNLSAGLLLMFKMKLQELSPPDSKEALLKQHVTPALDADGNPVWVGKGGQTVDVRTIQERLENLGVTCIDWSLLKKLTAMRNEVEHYYSKLPASGLAEAMAASFHLIQQFVPGHLGFTPIEFLGEELWKFLTAQEAFYKRELEICQKANKQVTWGHALLESAVDLLQCPVCKSALIKPLSLLESACDIIFVCTCSARNASYAEAAETIATIHHFADLYYAATKGGESPLEHCTSCGHFSYLTEEFECMLCLDDSPGPACTECGRTLESEIDRDDDLTRLCGMCRYAIEAD